MIGEVAFAVGCLGLGGAAFFDSRTRTVPVWWLALFFLVSLLVFAWRLWDWLT